MAVSDMQPVSAANLRAILSDPIKSLGIDDYVEERIKIAKCTWSGTAAGSKSGDFKPGQVLTVGLTSTSENSALYVTSGRLHIRDAGTYRLNGTVSVGSNYHSSGSMDIKIDGSVYETILNTGSDSRTGIAFDKTYEFADGSNLYFTATKVGALCGNPTIDMKIFVERIS